MALNDDQSISTAASSRAFLLTILDQVLTKGPCRRFEWARTSPLPQKSRVSSSPGARFILTLSGSKTLRFANDGSIKRRTFRPWEMLYVEPGGWTQPVWDRPHKAFSVVFWEEYTRFLWFQCRKGEPPEADRRWYHTHRPLNAAPRGVVQALNGLAREERSVPAVPIVQGLLLLLRDELSHDRPRAGGKAYQTYRMLADHVREAYGAQVNRNGIAARFRLNPDYVSQLFVRFAKMRFSEFLASVRIERAVELLRDSVLTVDEVGYQCGFADTGYFIKVFRRMHGTTPGRYRQRVVEQ